MLSTPRNDKGMRECVRDRVLLAYELEQGLFDKRALIRMALRVLKLFSVEKFIHNFQCSCSIAGQGDIDAGNSITCQGPILTLAHDKGQTHSWPKFRQNFSRATSMNLGLLRQFQRSLNEEVQQYPITFNSDRHLLYPWS